MAFHSSSGHKQLQMIANVAPDLLEVDSFLRLISFFLFSLFLFLIDTFPKWTGVGQENTTYEPFLLSTSSYFCKPLSPIFYLTSITEQNPDNYQICQHTPCQLKRNTIENQTILYLPELIFSSLGQFNTN